MKNITLFWCLKKMLVESWSICLNFDTLSVGGQPMLLFWILIVKLKFPNLLIMLLPFLKLWGQFLLAIWNFKVFHINIQLYWSFIRTIMGRNCSWNKFNSTQSIFLWKQVGRTQYCKLSKRCTEVRFASSFSGGGLASPCWEF